MPSIFNDKYGPVDPYLEVSAAQVAAALPGYFLLMRTPCRVTEFFIKNGTDAEVQLFLVNPNDPTPTNPVKHAWVKLGVSDSLNLSSNMPPQFYFPAGTIIYIQATGAAPATGKVAVVWWGA